MSHDGHDDRAIREAAAWAARLNSRAVDASTLEDFARWRRDPVNAAAYARLETLWACSGELGGDRDIAMAARDALARPDQGLIARLRGAMLRPAGGVAALILVIALIAIIVARLPSSYVTRVGEQRVVRLADGSRVRINTDSEVRVRLRSDRRLVSLVRGEAFFEVQHDPARRFVVATDAGDVEAVGTRFDVRHLAGQTRVVLAQGVVRATSRTSHRVTTLAPGEALWLGRGPGDQPERVDVEAATSWTEGQIVFHDMPLGRAVAEVNRYTDRPIVLKADGLDDAGVSGRFETGDIDSFILAVTTAFPLRAERSGDGHITLLARG